MKFIFYTATFSSSQGKFYTTHNTFWNTRNRIIKEENCTQGEDCKRREDLTIEAEQDCALRILGGLNPESRVDVHQVSKLLL